MGLFSKKEDRTIGVDIGAGGVKVVELLFEHGTYKLMTYGYSQRPEDRIDIPITDNHAEAVRHLKRVVGEAGVTAKKVVASLPMHSVFSSIIAVPHVKDARDMRALVERQAEKLMPIPLNEMVLDYQVLKGEPKRRVSNEALQATTNIQAPTKHAAMAGGADENVRVLITGARKDMVAGYTTIFKDAGLDLISLETEPFALVHALIGHDQSSIMILDIGSYRSNMTIVEQGVPFLTRSIKVGGAMVTRAIAEQLSVTVEEAEQMKYDLATGVTDAAGVPKAVEDLFQPIVNEIAYAIKLYAESDMTDRQQIEKVILTGGSAHLPGLDVFLADKLSVRTLVGDPWARVAVNEAMRPVLDDLGPRFSVAIGLAMRHAVTHKQASERTPQKKIAV